MGVSSPSLQPHPPLIVTPWHLDSIGIEILALVGGAVASGTVPGTNQIMYYPWYVQYPVTVTKVFWHDGATLSGNIDVGVYDSAAFAPTTRLVSSGATLQSDGSANTVRTIDVTDTIITPGLKFLAFCATSNTATLFRAAPSAAPLGRAIGIQIETGSSLPATAGAAGSTSTNVSLFGVILSPRTLAP